MRALGDFVYWKELGTTVATTHNAVSAILQSDDFRTYEENQSSSKSAYSEQRAGSLYGQSPPKHTILRELIYSALEPERLTLMQSEIAQKCDALIRNFPDEPFDLMQNFAEPLTVFALSQLFGLPDYMNDQLQSWSRAFSARELGNEASTAKASRELAAYIHEFVLIKREFPENDLFSSFIAAQKSQKISSDELVSNCILILNFGHEATMHAIGNAVRHLSEFYEVSDALNPNNIDETIEECLRVDPPIHLVVRVAESDATVLGQHLESKAKIGCLLGSACHDEARWRDPDQFKPFRENQISLAFGSGIHQCFGAPLARLVLRIALPLLLLRFPETRLAAPQIFGACQHIRYLRHMLVQI